MHLRQLTSLKDRNSRVIHTLLAKQKREFDFAINAGEIFNIGNRRHLSVLSSCLYPIEDESASIPENQA